MTKKLNTQSVESSVDASQMNLPGVPTIPDTLATSPTPTAALSVAALRLPQDFGSAAGVKKVLTVRAD